MALLNYTTQIDAAKTVSEIMGMLARSKAQSILAEYDEFGNVSALQFRIQTVFGQMAFRLPANVEAVAKTLDHQATARKIPNRFHGDKDQARRVAWRIVKDWLEAQLAILETKSVQFEEIMLPFAISPENGNTVYQNLVAEKFSRLALPAPK